VTSALSVDLPSRTSTVRAVCLDIDDTLVDYGRTARTVLAATCGRDDAWALWERNNKVQFARLLAGEIDYDTMRRERLRAFFADLGEWISPEEAAEREARRMAAMERSWCLFEDALPCLEWLRAAGLRIAAITNASGVHQRVKLASLGLAEYFDTVVVAGEVRVAKPDPVIFHTACAALGVPPEDVVHVGDRLDLDALGARNAGLRGVWLNRTGEVASVPPDVPVISSLSELPELLVCELVLQGA